ncbi:hypothetical protein ACUW97_002135 [Kocuria rhizophila]
MSGRTTGGCGPGQGQHRGRGRRHRAHGGVTGGRAQGHEPPNPLRVVSGQGLRNHPAQGEPEDVRARHAQHRQGVGDVVGHVLHRVLPRGQVPAQQLAGRGRGAGGAERAPRVPVVHPEHVVPVRRQSVHERLRPRGQVEAQPGDQHHRAAVPGPVRAHAQEPLVVQVHRALHPVRSRPGGGRRRRGVPGVGPTCSVVRGARGASRGRRVRATTTPLGRLAARGSGTWGHAPSLGRARFTAPAGSAPRSPARGGA